MKGRAMLDRGTLLRRTAALVLVVLVAEWPSPSSAALQSVSGVPDPALDPDALTEVVRGGAKESVAYSLAHGFPLWFEDENGLKLELCLDQRVELPGGAAFFPCLTEEPFTSAPISFPSNFGPEAFYWVATAGGAFTSLVNGQPFLGTALLVLAQEAAFATELTVDGQQVAFGRIRVRFDVPVPGRYRVTHPYGVVEYEVGALALEDDREVAQTQDVGNLAPADVGPPPAGNVLLALEDGPDPGAVVPPPGYPAVNAGIVSSAATGIGPFLVPAPPHGPITALNGRTYLADPGAGDVHLEVPVLNGPFGNAFRIELLDPPPGVVLNSAAFDPASPDDPENLARASVIELDRFQVAGKVFDDGPNRAPAATDDAAATTKGKPVLVDVVANDTDLVDALNVHGIDPRAIALPTGEPGTYLLTRAQATERGGTVRRATDFRTGKTTFRYTPPADFTGVDSFRYVVQDTGGLVSAPATVTVTVEDLAVARAEYRPRAGKWRIAGSSSDGEENTVALFGGPRARLAPAAGAGTAAAGTVTLRLTADAIEFRLSLDPPPSTPVTEVHVHVIAPGQAGDGPPIFALHDHLAEPAFAGTKSGTLTDAHRIFGSAQVEAGIGSIADAIAAILAGDAYVTLRTAQHPAGELRGPLALPGIGVAAVDAASGEWSFAGKSLASPGRAPASVNARSSNGVWTLGTPLEVR